MASNYSGDPNAIQLPSSPPGPGQIPVFSIPAGSDVRTIESIMQQMKTTGDYIAHIQTAARIEIPSTPVTTSVYTAPVYNAFGGTVTPTAGPVNLMGSSGAYRFVIKIVTGGAVGVAQFKSSFDGGATFGGTQTTAASMTDATTGITLAWAGTLTLNGTASFRMTMTPNIIFVDAAGNRRWMIDHNGLPTGGRINVINENWLVAPGASASYWSSALGTGSAIAISLVAGYASPFLQFTPSSTSGVANYTLAYTAPVYIANNAGSVFVMEFELGLNAAAAGTASNVSWFCGLDSGTTPLADLSLIGLYKKYNSANYSLLGGNGSTTLNTITNPTTNPTSGTVPTDRIKIEVLGSSSPIGAYQARFTINEIPVGIVSSANLPGATGMRLMFGSSNEGGAPTGSPLGYIGPVIATWNRFLSGVTL